MSKMGNELERRLDENKYALYYALTKMWEGNEISENDETRVSVRVAPSSEAVLQARIVLDAIENNKGGRSERK